LSSEMRNVAEAEALVDAEGNMCGTAMRGADALPESETTSRWKGMCRNLGGLAWPAVAEATPGRNWKSYGRSGCGTGEESDGSIVPMKPSNKTVMNSGGEVGGKGPGRRDDAW